jgi:hypothetical protein
VAAFFAGDLLNGRPLTELFCAAFIGAAAVWVQYRTALLFLPWRGALALALLFAFGTTEWSLASRNLYPHGLTILLLSAALYLILNSKARTARRSALLAGFLLALAFCVRPSNAISCVVLALYFAIHRRRELSTFLLGATPPAALFFAYQISVRHSIVPLYLTAPRTSTTFVDGLAIDLFSPSRGLFVFTPVFLLSIASIVPAWRRRWCFPLFPYLLAILILHSLIVLTLWPGHCYGPRYFSDMTPLFILFLIPGILLWRESTGAARTVCAAAFLVLAACGLFVHGHGATSIAANQWSALPVDVDTARWRVWDWHDPQFLRGLR